MMSPLWLVSKMYAKQEKIDRYAVVSLAVVTVKLSIRRWAVTTKRLYCCTRSTSSGGLGTKDRRQSNKSNATNIFCRQCMAATEVLTYSGCVLDVLCVSCPLCSGVCVLFVFVVYPSCYPSDSLVTSFCISRMSRRTNHALASGDVTSKISSCHISMGGGGIPL